MKRIIMLFSIAFISLSLASCQSDKFNLKFKSYKTEVTSKQFYKEFDNAFEENYISSSLTYSYDNGLGEILTDIENDFDFEYSVDLYTETNNEQNYYSPGKTVTNFEYNHKSYVIKADMDNYLMEKAIHNKEYKNLEGSEYSSEEKKTNFFMIRRNSIIKVLPEELTYSTFNTEYQTPFEYAQYQLIDVLLDIQSYFENASKSTACEYYIDDNIYTIVKTNYENGFDDLNYEYNNEVTEIYQIKFAENSILYQYECVETNSQETKTCVKQNEYIDRNKIEIKQKNVSLKKPDINSYIFKN